MAAAPSHFLFYGTVYKSSYLHTYLLTIPFDKNIRNFFSKKLKWAFPKPIDRGIDSVQKNADENES